MKFATWVFRIAGVYGILVIVPLYVLEQKINTGFPPAMTHPENYYAFLGVTLVWQIFFLVISDDPVRYRTMMLLAVLEKMSVIPTFLILFPQGRLPDYVLPGMIVDLILGALFVISYLKTNRVDSPS